MEADDLHLIVEQDQILDVENTPEFCWLMSKLEIEGALVTDQSELYDFCFSGSDWKVGGGDPIVEWEEWIFKEIKKEYGIDLSTSYVTLVSLCEQMRNSSRAMLQ